MSIFTLRNSVDLPHSLADCISKLGTPDGYPAVRKLVPTGRACKEVGRERVWITDDDLKGDTDVSLLSLPAAGAGDGAPAGARSVERVDYEVESEVKVVLLNVKVGRAESHVWDEKTCTYTQSSKATSGIDLTARLTRTFEVLSPTSTRVVEVVHCTVSPMMRAKAEADISKMNAALVKEYHRLF